MWSPEVLHYAEAVLIMQARPAHDPTSWRFQAGVHGSYDRNPGSGPWKACQHGSWFFLPWHRMYVHFFERIVRAAVVTTGGPQDFALPYWNYDQPYPSNSLPRAFREPALPDGRGNPLHLPKRRKPQIANGFQLPAEVTGSRKTMEETRFTAPAPLPSFGGAPVGPSHFESGPGQLELQPHNVVHNALGGHKKGRCGGGWMSDENCAALDPVFWLHHANIDRLWVEWIRLGRGRKNPAEARWRNQSFSFYDEGGAVHSLTCAEVEDTARLGYTYA